MKYSFGFNYILLIIVIYLSFFLLIKILYKKFFLLNFDQIKYYNYEYKIFILGSLISLISFILFSNYFHREVFLILTIPFIISLYNFTKSKFLKYFIIFMIFKYFYLFFYSYININDGLILNGKRVFSDYFIITIFIKSFLDFI